MSGRLQDKVALITGTGGGQGRVAALRFAEEGALVVGRDVKEDGNLETVEMVRQAGHEMTGMAPVDLGGPDGARDWVEQAVAVHGRVDVLYNNASAARFGTVDTLSVDDWNFTIRNELDLIFYVTRSAWPHLAKRGGVILNTGSIAGVTAARHTPQLAHAATKGAVISMTRQLAAEGAPHGIRAVAISPGAIETPGTQEFFTQPAVREALLADQLIQRIGQSDDVVELAVHLASDAASFITGTNFIIGGGVTSV